MPRATAPIASHWWERRAYLALLVAMMALPLLWPAVPPLVDFPGHLGRYRIQLGGSPLLDQFYAVHWTLIGNLGVDLAVIPLAHLIGLEPAAKLIVLAIPPLTATGYLLIAQELHGRVPPTAAFALPLILGYPFQFGFVNHALAVALALLAFALWLRLARAGRWRLRAGLFVPIALVVWTAHVFGWAVLGLLCFAAELVRARATGRPPWQLQFAAATACLPLAPPLLLMVLWRHGGPPAETSGFLDWRMKLDWIESVLRDRWKWLDGDSAELICALIGLGVIGVLRFERTLFVAAALLAAAYVALPRMLLGSNYADMRLAPVMLAVAVLALRPRPRAPRWLPPALALAALAFFAVRIGASTLSLYHYDQGFRAQLEAVPHIPRGSRVFALVAPPCPRGWEGPRLDNLANLAIVRAEAFVNGQWTDPGAQAVTVRLPIPRAFAASPSQIVRLADCDRPEPLLGDMLRAFPRERFDQVWLINVPPSARPRDPRLVPVWESPAGALYRIAAVAPH